MASGVADRAPEGEAAVAEGMMGPQARVGTATMRPRFGHLADPWTASQLVGTLPGSQSPTALSLGR